MRYSRTGLLVLGGWLVACGWLQAAPVVRGTFSTDGVTGQSVAAHGWVEQKVYASPLEKGAGAGVQTAAQPPGRFEIPAGFADLTFEPGRYAVFGLCYDGIPAFSVRSDVRLVAEGGEPVELKSPAHYSVMFNKSYEEWGKSPWVQHDEFYQTFVATGRHITRIATKLSDKSGDHAHFTLNYAIYEPSDGPPSTWKMISPVRSRYLSSGTDPIIHIFHVPYRSSEMELVPGRTYAVRFWRDPKSKAEKFSLVVRPDKGDGYKGGHLYIGDEPRKDLDAYAYISGGEPGTLVNYAPLGDPDLKDLIGSSRRFGQTFKATGTGLLAADIIYTTGVTTPPSLPFTFQVYDGVGGEPIGPARTGYGFPLAFQGRAAAIWSPGEVPLTPGKMYYIEWTSPKEVNTWSMNEGIPGQAFRDGKPAHEADLMMSIVETELKVGTRRRAETAADRDR